MVALVDPVAGFNPIADLEQLLSSLSTVRAINVTQDVLSGWCEQLTGVIHGMKTEQQQKKSQFCSARSSKRSSLTRPIAFPTVADRGRKEPRVVSRAPTQADYSKIRNCGICILSVLEGILHHVRCDYVALMVPYRGQEDEFRCLCSLSRNSNKIGGTTTIIRGTSTVEYAAYSTGYVVNTCPKALLFMDETHNEECVSMVELMGDPARSDIRSHYTARLCSPVRGDPAAATPLGVVSILTSSGPATFTAEVENMVYDASHILGSLLLRAGDYACLQACFSKGDLREELHSLAPVGIDIPNTHTQMVYRMSSTSSSDAASSSSSATGGSASGSGAALLVVNAAGKVLRLRDGTPIRTVFDQMQRLQQSWFAAVRLNVELKNKCEEQEQCLAALLARSRVHLRAAGGSGGTDSGAGNSMSTLDVPTEKCSAAGSPDVSHTPSLHEAAATARRSSLGGGGRASITSLPPSQAEEDDAKASAPSEESSAAAAERRESQRSEERRSSLSSRIRGERRSTQEDEKQESES